MNCECMHACPYVPHWDVIGTDEDAEQSHKNKASNGSNTSCTEI